MVSTDTATCDGTTVDCTIRVLIDEHEVLLLADAINSRNEQRAPNSQRVQFGLSRMAARSQELLPIFCAILYSSDFFTTAPEVEGWLLGSCLFLRGWSADTCLIKFTLVPDDIVVDAWLESGAFAQIALCFGQLDGVAPHNQLTSCISNDDFLRILPHELISSCFDEIRFRLSLAAN